MTEKTKRRSRTAGVLLILAVLLLVLIWVDINAGYQQITLTQLWQIICGKGEKGVTYTLVNLRLPRVLTSLLVGVGLSAAGCVLQGVSRNEMEEIRFSHLYGLQRQVPQGCPADEILINQRKGHYDDRQVFSGRREPSCG